MRPHSVLVLLVACDHTGSAASPDASTNVHPPARADAGAPVPDARAGADARATCTDADGDGYGDGCAAGPDCDDHWAAIHPGATEVCNEADDNCDGRIDEGVRTPCGNCDTSCRAQALGGDMPLPTAGSQGAMLDGVGADLSGAIVLDSTTITLGDVWIANTDDSSVSRIDADAAREVARYGSANPEATGLLDAGLDVPLMTDDCPGWAGPGHCPSRTAVDLSGSVWVANRAFGRQGTVARIAARTADCVDRAHGLAPPDGAIETSFDADGDGAIDWDCNGDGLGDDWNTVCPAGVAKEYWGGDDECIVLTAPVGGIDGLPRALAVDIDGNAWVGLFNAGEFVKLSPSGELLATVAGVGSPYGALIDGHGVLWAVNGCCDGNKIGALVRIDTTDPVPAPTFIDAAGAGCFGRYGLTLDLSGNVWIAADDRSANGCTDDGAARALAWRYTPATGAWLRVDPGADLAHGRPQGLAPDARGDVWVALQDGWVAGVTSDGAYLGAYDVDPTAEGAGAVYSIGVSTDQNGDVWVGNRAADTAVRFDPATGATTATVPIGRRPYTYSDYTGFVLRHLTVPRGTYTLRLDGCAPGATRWRKIDWTATTPAGTSIALYVRSGDDPATVAAAPRVGPWSAPPADLEAPPGPIAPNPSHALQLEFELTSDDPSVTPALRGVTATWECVAGPG